MLRVCIRLLLPAVLLACSSPMALHADTFTFRNDCRVPLIVQVSSVQRGALKRDQGLLRPGEATAKMRLDSEKVITIYDSRTSRILFRNLLKVRKSPVFYTLEPDPLFPVRLRIREIPPPKSDRPPGESR